MRKLPVLMTIATIAAAATGVYVIVDSPAVGQATESESRQSGAAEDTAATDHGCGAVGEYQKQVETSLDSLGDYGTVHVDGEQSAEDCTAIKALQTRMGIEPANGRADELTRSVAERLAEPSFGDCEAARSGRTVCVDLTRQTLWVVEDGERGFGPTVVRTGKPGHASTTGTFTINHKADREWSEPYEVWLPFWQHYYAGEGLHEATSYLHDPSAGSHGCVNLLPSDAEELYGMLDYGDTIEIFGHRPGT